ncbi:SMP-30/gluconolactonase/LRE family protein [Ferrimonas senticii]|uniref:SMP-30/gluconolactonase/LRE family protein n=1 Tax=Ferrimonas senticii TaxID=394566 RepID=UPI00040FFCEC|nr:SMP-30/gluconolactonase/LRE family protein [Ferrimonas senticii]
MPASRFNRQQLAIMTVIVALLAYLSLWPVAISPTAWQPPTNLGYQGVYQANDKLSQLTLITTPSAGPEAVAVNRHGQLYFGLSNGDIARLNGQQVEIVGNTGGRPLGLRFDKHDNLYIADPLRGLLRLSRDGQLQTLLTEVAGKPLLYANSVAISRDGSIYLSESSQRHSAAQYGVFAASLLDINEHRGSGRIIRYRPSDGHSEQLYSGINFANGIELIDNEQGLLVVETGSYRLLKLHLTGARQGQTEVFIDNLPGFPDNLSRGADGTYWLGLVSPRNGLLDWMADKPVLRTVVERLPAWLRPKPQRYGHLLGLNSNAEIRANLQDPSGRFAFVTGAAAHGDKLYLSSLHDSAIGIWQR